MGEGRAKRTSVVDGRGGKRFKNALEELKELKKSGTKRVDRFEVKEEESVYDEVNEEQYARIVQKRREEGGGFVVGHDGMGYTDIGEEIEWVNEDARRAEEEEEREKKKKGGGAKKRVADQQPVPGAKERMHKMLQTAAIRNKSKNSRSSVVQNVDSAETDALLEDILGDLGGGGSDSTPRTKFSGSGPTPLRSRMSTTPTMGSVQRSIRNPMQTPQSRSTLRVPSSVGVARSTGPSSRMSKVLSMAPVSTDSQPELDAENYGAVFDNFDAQGYDGDDACGDPNVDMKDAYGTAPNNEKADLKENVKAEVKTEEDIASDQEHKAEKTTIEHDAMKEETYSMEEEAENEAVVKDWQALYEAGDGMEEEGQAEIPWEDDGTLSLDEEARLPMYLLDAHEEISSPGTVYMFGKTPVGNNQFASCCAVVKGIQKTVFVVPRVPVSLPLDLLDSAQGEERKEKLGELHAAFSEVKAEVREVLGNHGVSKMIMKPVKRTYAFEEKAVPHGHQWVLKVRFPQPSHSLPLQIDGDTFIKMFGTTQSSLEALMLKRRIMGPSWIGISKPRRIDKNNQVSYCSIEVEIEGHKSIVSSPSGSRPAPPISVASLSLKTLINPSNGANEVVAASVVYMQRVDTDGPAPIAKKEIRHFSAIRKLEGVGYPHGFEALVKKANDSDASRRNGGAIVAMQPNERALLTMLVMRLREIDVDAYVGHNFSGYDLNVLLHRMKELKVPHWACLGRLKRSKFPSLGGGGHSYGSGAGAGAMSVIAGRLLCDTYIAARDLVRETEYTLTALSRNLLGELRVEISAADIKTRFLSSEKLMEMLKHTESDAWLALRLASYLAVLPLTRQLAELSGSLWSKALLSQRAQRIEYLLLHEFHNNKFILPNKMSGKDRAAVDGDEEGQGGSKKGGKGPQYAGGLVLEPKKGLYERYILLLDFNSLYPSIIQEYNICFTTVERPAAGAMAALPDASTTKAPLPRVIGGLVERRRRVKEMIKTERDAEKREQLNIRQQALKLLANSMYGCLGFSNSRFYAKPLAELITSQGREILQSTVDLVQGSVGKEVIYGDTDSIMVDTNTDALPDVIALGHAIKKEVNKRYRLLEIEMDGVFKRMLLLKKKKYAAIKVERGPDGNEVEVVEAKGLDMVRRDWCPLAKQASQFSLDQILSGKPREEVVAAIHEHLAALSSGVREGKLPLNKFIITKQLTKKPEDYPDAKNQPHVQVALRRRAQGKRDGVMAGETIPYIICDITNEVDGRTEHSLADRARSPEEVSSGSMQIDTGYYIAQQLFPVICRLVAPIEGTDAAHIAESLGMDPSRFKASGINLQVNPAEALETALAGLDNDDRFKDCDPLELTGKSGQRFVFKGVRELLKAEDSAVETALLAPEDNIPLSPVQVANQIRLKARQSIKKYYQGWMVSDDEITPCRTRNICLRESSQDVPIGYAPADLKCSGTMHPEVTEAALYTQLSYYHRLFDADGAIKALGDNKDAQLAAQKKLAPIRSALDATTLEAERIMNASGFRWVDLSNVFGSIKC